MNYDRGMGKEKDRGGKGGAEVDSMDSSVKKVKDSLYCLLDVSMLRITLKGMEDISVVRALVLSQRTWVWFLASIWQFTAPSNSTSR